MTTDDRIFGYSNRFCNGFKSIKFLSWFNKKKRTELILIQ